jgi:molybdopterin-guanine dinucleotide biosynthesis protein B
MLKNAQVPLLGFAAFSNTGKTTLLANLLPLLNQRGLRVGVIKHARHGFDIDHPGKDSYVLREAGAAQMLIAAPQRWALVMETPGQGDPKLDDLLPRLDQRHLDCILVEGFKHEQFPKIELHRPSQGHPLLCLGDETIIAVASDGPLKAEIRLPLLDLNNPIQVVDFVYHRLFGNAAQRAQKPE